MEYRIEKLLDGLESQRCQLVKEVASLNENLPNYGMKINDINMQINQIDNQISNFIHILKDLEIQKMNNELTIKNK
jgi:septal ring factor EnvC (AmiA/AmiB activator)